MRGHQFPQKQVIALGISVFPDSDIVVHAWGYTSPLLFVFRLTRFLRFE